MERGRPPQRNLTVCSCDCRCSNVVRGPDEEFEAFENDPPFGTLYNDSEEDSELIDDSEGPSIDDGEVIPDVEMIEVVDEDGEIIVVTRYTAYGLGIHGEFEHINGDEEVLAPLEIWPGYAFDNGSMSVLGYTRASTGSMSRFSSGIFSISASQVLEGITDRAEEIAIALRRNASQLSMVEGHVSAGFYHGDHLVSYTYSPELNMDDSDLEIHFGSASRNQA